jgi:phage replication-related protein YjqB (UPF0714/DUF867 family)
MYASFAALKGSEREGRDYRIVVREVGSGGSIVAVMAPHGGDIEPGTSEIASAIASDNLTFYSFEGTKPSRNGNLHITSTEFDEPTGLRVASESKAVAAIHGCKGREKTVCIGGLNRDLKTRCKVALETAGFVVETREGLHGKNSQNLCNLGSDGGGVQFELTSGLRRTMFGSLTREGRKVTTEVFERFVSALRATLEQYAEAPSEVDVNSW